MDLVSQLSLLWLSGFELLLCSLFLPCLLDSSMTEDLLASQVLAFCLFNYVLCVQAREAVEMRAQVERKMAQKEKEKHEEKLREMAQKARERRAGIKTHVEKGTFLCY